MMDTTSDRNPVDVLADEFAARLRDGSAPSIDEYVEKNPELADDIRATFPSIEMMERLSRKEHTERKFESRTSHLTGHTPGTLGDFQIVREIGRGGMGIVYEAVEKSLKRRVALKVLGPGVAGSPKQIQRFIREAEAAARLHHTNIVPVYGISEEKDLHFFAMQFIDGVPLSDVIRLISGRPTRSEDSAMSGGGTLAEKLLTPLSGDASRAGVQPANVSKETASSFDAASAARALLSGTLTNRSLRPAGDSSSSNMSIAESSGSNSWNGDLQRLSERSNSNGTTSAKTASKKTGKTAASISNDTDGDSQAEAQNELPEISLRYWRSVARIGAAVADALHYSHQHGVLHRDIKPSNLLLDRQGVVWVTDFGLARHEDQEGITNSGDIVGTLRYMAPEQFNGDSNNLSDIYSLGLTLYELLALRPAFEESRHGPLISQKTSSMPSVLRSINRDIPRDLETITQKACATNPADRYATAGQLANDLRRFLDDRPVLARRATTSEQFVRWARRNPVVASLSGATVVLLATVAVVFAVGQYRTQAALDIVEQQKTELEERQARLDQSLDAERAASKLGRAEYARAEKNLQLAVKAFDSIIDNVASRGVPQSLTLSLGNEDPADEATHSYDTMLTAADADLLEALLAFFDDFAGQNQTDLRAQSASARKRVGDIQQRLGRFEEAEATYRRSLEAFETLAAQKPEDLQLVIAQARILNEIAIAASRRGAMWGAVNEHNRAKSILQTTAGVMDTPSGKLELARTLGLLTTISSRTGMSALMTLTMNDSSDGRSSSSSRPRGDGRPSPNQTSENRPDRNRSTEERSSSNPADDKRQSQEVATGNSATEKPKVGSNPDSRNQNSNNESRTKSDRQSNQQPGPDRQGGSRRGSGNGESQRGGFREWSEIFRKSSDQSLALLNELLEDEPSRPDYRLALAIAWRNRVTVSRIIDDAEMGQESITTAIEHLDELARDFPDKPVYRFELADTLCMRASRNSEKEPTPEWRERIGRAIVLCEDLIESYPNVTEYQALMGTSLSRMGVLLQAQKNFEPAADAFHQAIVWQRPLAERFSTMSLYQVAYLQSLWGLSEVSLAQGDPAAAIGYLETAIDRLQILTRNTPENRMLVHYLEKLRRRRHEMTRPSDSAKPAA